MYYDRIDDRPFDKALNEIGMFQQCRQSRPPTCLLKTLSFGAEASDQRLWVGGGRQEIQWPGKVSWSWPLPQRSLFEPM